MSTLWVPPSTPRPRVRMHIQPEPECALVAVRCGPFRSCRARQQRSWQCGPPRERRPEYPLSTQVPRTGAVMTISFRQSASTAQLAVRAVHHYHAPVQRAARGVRSAQRGLGAVLTDMFTESAALITLEYPSTPEWGRLCRPRESRFARRRYRPIRPPTPAPAVVARRHRHPRLRLRHRGFRPSLTPPATL